MGSKNKKKSSGSTKPYFDPIDPKVKFPELEKQLLDQWHRDGTVDEYLHRNDSSDKYFSFQDGPITANGPMGVHHAWGRTYKDLWQRYKNMQGFRQRFQNGFDAQGLWVEVEVEKDLGFKNKKDIEDYGIDKFVEKCKKRVLKFSKIQTEQSKRLGYFMDWDNSYYTMSNENNYMIWHFLKVCHENGWLYKGKESVPWCPRCQTAISQHEMLTEDYKEVFHKSIYFAMPIQDRKDEYLLVWTTTPWTLPANIAVAVDKKKEYSLVETDTGRKYWIASEAAGRLFGKETKPERIVKGDKLVGLKYTWAFDHLPAVKIASENSRQFHTVIATDDRIMPISTEEGTGMVHTAVSAGTEDFKIGQKLGLPMIPIIEDDASYTEGLGEFTGKNAKLKPEVILDYLANQDITKGTNWVFRIEKYKHRYPGCWRCKMELVWKVTDEWYIAMDRLPTKKNKKADHKTLRKRMKTVAKKIRWIPEFGLKRELDWLDNMHDWLISKKNRYWGLCLPIWECEKCGYFEVVGSKEELRKKAIEGWKEFEGKTPHKPQLDFVKLRCPKCKSAMSRIEAVGNPWLDAGIVCYSTISKDNKGKPLYLTNKNEWRKWFPVDFVTEGFAGQFKNWFYSMIAMSTVLENQEPYKTVLGHGTVLAEDGREMHKSWGNSIEFNEGADKIGVDVMRWMYAKEDPVGNVLFGYGVGDEVRRQFHLTLWNIYNFFVRFANLDGWKPASKVRLSSKNKLDVWMIARLTGTTEEVTQSLDEYNARDATSSLEALVKDMSLWYIRRSRERVGVNSKDNKDKENFYQTLWFTLSTLSKLLAPINPFISDAMYKNLAKEKSVHLADWPNAEELKAELGANDKFTHSILVDISNVRKVVERGHAVRKESGIPVRQPLQMVRVISNTKLHPDLHYLICDELNVKRVDWEIRKGVDDLQVELDTVVTPELEEEGKTRGLIRKIQNERKKLGVSLKEKVVVSNDWLPQKKALLEQIKKKAVVSSISKGKFKVVVQK